MTTEELLRSLDNDMELEDDGYLQPGVPVCIPDLKKCALFSCLAYKLSLVYFFAKTLDKRQTLQKMSVQSLKYLKVNLPLICVKWPHKD